VQGMMRCLSTLLFGTLLVLQTGGARLTVSSDTLPLIDDFDRVIQQRLSEPMPNAFGMSRIAVPSSFGKHFAPVTRNRRDFVPENDSERKAVAALESRKLAVGLYLFGELIVREDAAKFNSRALKGPGAITVHTPRPDWYPSARVAAMKEKDSASLPNWVKIYPVAQRAMRSFQDGRLLRVQRLRRMTAAFRAIAIGPCRARRQSAVSQSAVSCMPFARL